MAKRWFLDLLGRYVIKSRVREMCRLMELSDRETSLILERFCGRKTMDQCEHIFSRDVQKELVPSLDSRVKGWCEANIGFFTFTEVCKVCQGFESDRKTAD